MARPGPTCVLDYKAYKERRHRESVPGGESSPFCPASQPTALIRLPCRNIVDYPRSVNVFVGNDMPGLLVPSGYTSVPGASSDPTYGHIYLWWSILSLDGRYDQTSESAWFLWHQLGHFLGLQDTSGMNGGGVPSCSNDDGVNDTPVSLSEWTRALMPIWGRGSPPFLSCALYSKRYSSYKKIRSINREGSIRL